MKGCQIIRICCDSNQPRTTMNRSKRRHNDGSPIGVSPPNQEQATKIALIRIRLSLCNDTLDLFFLNCSHTFLISSEKGEATTPPPSFIFL